MSHISHYISHNSILRIAAWIVSVVFHPLNMVLLGCVFIILLVPGITVAQLYTFCKTLLLMLFVLPLAFVPLYWLYAKLMRQEFSEKHKRLALLFSTSVIYLFTSYNLIVHSSLTLVNTYILACSVLMIMSFCISIFWKISLHAIGVSGFLALVIQLSLHAHFFAFILLPIVLVIAGLVLSSRLYLQAHTPAQVAAGFALGLCVTFCML
ncbi:MAG: phosphatase PAP2 family protein [Bacteroidales bacterium]|nr:phosphatase PAP2 family protein [Bacteroidales bacterium]